MAANATQEIPPTAVRGRRLGLIITALLLGMLLAALDQTIVSTALPTIVGDLGDASHLSWAVTAYLLSGSGFRPDFTNANVSPSLLTGLPPAIHSGYVHA